MTDHEHGEDDDDLSLGSMRSLFREMNDVEPPSRGMDALLAAARQQAQVNAAKHAEREAEENPSLFRKFLGLFARPPVLAFATIALLVGGSIIVTRHKSEDDMRVPSAARERGKDKNAETSGANAPREEDGKKADLKQAVKDEIRLDQRASGSGSGMLGGDSGGKADDESPRLETQKPKTVTTVEAPRGQGQAQQGPQHIAPMTPPPSTGESINLDPGTTSGKNGEQERSPTVAAPPPPPPPPTAPAADDNLKPSVDAVDHAPVSTAKPTGKKPPEAPPVAQKPTNDELLAKSRAAATSNDCPTAKAIANKIAAQDGDFYRQKVATDPQIGKCIQKAQIAK